ncbi:MAG: Hsp20/alpha crystallin family protein [Prevotellaceae bacterium]|jgi:HSP20 family protein|nr:Hsp20/alpha crystallin family protein [Prevotellaceae bacterium]
MTLIRNNQNWLPFVLNDLLEKGVVEKADEETPAINIKEYKTGFEVEIAAPGLKKEDFSIRIDEDDNLVISAEKKTESEVEENERHYIRKEFGYVAFTEKLSLPENADKEAVTAKFDNGVLTISVPKVSEEELKKAQKTIEIA